LCVTLDLRTIGLATKGTWWISRETGEISDDIETESTLLEGEGTSGEIEFKGELEGNKTEESETGMGRTILENWELEDWKRDDKENILMKSKIKQLVTFDTIRVTKKKTRCSPRIKFGSISSKSRSKTKTANNSKVRETRSNWEKTFKRSFIG